MPITECTTTERAFLDSLYSNFKGAVFVEPADKGVSVYKPQKIMAYNFYVIFGGHGGPESSWVYQQPGLCTKLFVDCLQEHGEVEIKT